MKKLLVVGVIVLFLGLAIAPSINANISKASVDSELVEFTTEVCGLNGVTPNTVLLSKEDAEEVEQLFDSIRERLNATETREESEEIFKEVVVELDKYGLLGSLSVKQAQRLVIGGYQDARAMKISERIFSRLQKNNSNYLCLIAGATNGTNFDSQLELFCGRISVLVSFVGPILFDKFPLYTFFILGYFLLNIFNSVNPVAITSRINLGGEKGGGWNPEFVEFYAHGWIITMGLLGTHRYDGKILGAIPLYGTGTLFEGYLYTFSPGLLGFTGLHIYNLIQAKHFYLGSALWVNFEEA